MAPGFPRRRTPGSDTTYGETEVLCAASCTQ